MTLNSEPPALEIRTEEAGEAIVIILGGQIDLYNDRILGAELNRLFEAGHRRFVLEMADVSFVDSAGFGLLIGTQKSFREQGGRIHYANVPRTVEAVVKLSRLQHFIAIFPSRDAALEAFQAIPETEAGGASGADESAQDSSTADDT